MSLKDNGVHYKLRKLQELAVTNSSALNVVDWYHDTYTGVAPETLLSYQNELDL
jgi:hypothetical protein